MTKLVLMLATMGLAASASALGPDVTNRFPILQNPSLDTAQLYYKKDIGTNLDEAKQYANAMKWVKESGWTSAHTDLCFDVAASTMEINMCASNQLDFVMGTIGQKFQDVKKAVRGSETIKAGGMDTIDAVKFLQNAAVAQGKIVNDLCELDSMSWYQGTGRTAAWIGCQSGFLAETKDFDALAVFASTKPVVVAADADPADSMTDAGYMVEQVRQRVKNAVDAGDTSFDEQMLVDADKDLNTEYANTKKYYKDSYSDPELYTDVNGQLLSDYATDLLKKYENGWIRYRDAYCQAYSVFLFPNAADQAKYGGFARLDCLRSQTYTQTARLRNIDRSDSPN